MTTTRATTTGPARRDRLRTYRYADLSTGVLPRHEMDTPEKVPSGLTTVIVHERGAWVRLPHPVLDAADLQPQEWRGGRSCVRCCTWRARPGPRGSTWTGTDGYPTSPA